MTTIDMARVFVVDANGVVDSTISEALEAKPKGVDLTKPGCDDLGHDDEACRVGFQLAWLCHRCGRCELRGVDLRKV